MPHSIKLFSITSLLFLLIVCFHSYSETININARYSPSMGNNTFTITTPQSGICTSHPQMCKESQTYSAKVAGYVTLMHATINAGADPRMGMYFKMPGAWRNVTVTNKSGQSATVQFRVASFGAVYETHTDWTAEKHNDAWVGGSFAQAPSPCTVTGQGVAGTRQFIFRWNWPVSDTACYKIAAIDLGNEPYVLLDMIITYEIKTPDPMQMPAGDYAGVLRFHLGPGGDMDFGDAFEPSNTAIDIDIHLTVEHELSITTTSQDKQVALQPCKPGQICTPDQGEANWERWMVSRVTPQLTGQSNFGITSTGNFTVYLACADGQVGQDCALKSDNTGQLVPFRSSLNLPTNIVDSTTGATVVQRPLGVGKDPAQNIFTTKTYGQDQKGSIDFLVPQRDVEAMLSTRPDTYRGGVTVMFDQSVN